MKMSMRENEINDLKTPYKYSGASHYKILVYMIRTSLSLLVLGIFCLFVIREFPMYDDISQSLNKCKLWHIWSICARIISDFFNAGIASVVSGLITFVTLFFKRENRPFYLQIITFCQNYPGEAIKMGVQTVVAIVLGLYSSQSYQTASALFTLSILVLFGGVLIYAFKYNNESQYYLEDRCELIIKLSQKDKKKRFKQYISTLMPKNSEKANTIENDVELLMALFKYVEFDRGTDNDHECQNIMKYFESVIIPFIVGLMSSYRENRYGAISHLKKILDMDLNKNLFFNKMIRYFLLVVLRQYAIQYNRDDNEDNEEHVKTIEDWLRSEVSDFFKLYEMYDVRQLHNYDSGYCYQYLYTEYIDQLHENEVIRACKYCTEEMIYIKERRHLELLDWKTQYLLPYSYVPSQIVFLNEGEKKINLKV